MNEKIIERINPFFLPYNTPHDTVPFDKSRLEDYEEAFMEGIRRDNEDIDNTIHDPAEPTFDNTIARVDLSKGENYYDLLDRVSTVFSCLLSAETNDDLDDLAEKMTPILTKHENDVSLNKQLFERIKVVYDKEKAGKSERPLTDEEKMLLDDCYDGFVRSGALLSDEKKEHLRQLTEEASILSL